MDLFSVLTMVGGLALFLYGMHMLGDSLAKLAGGRLEKILESLTSNPVRAVLLGAGVTAVIQSSSATTVMVVGFVNSGIMKLSQVTGIIMGANVGTTITAWILSLTGIEGDSILVSLLKPSSFAPVLAMIGVVMLTFSNRERRKDIGSILLGFAILMIGMDTMSGAVEPLADVPQFTNILLMFSDNPVLGMLAGLILTAIIQSSSASVGILQALCLTGSVSYGTAIPIIMGQHVGTCITALLSAVGTKKNAQRAACIHLYFNVIGTVIFMIMFYAANLFLDFAFLGAAATPFGIAVIHTVSSVLATCILLPFRSGLEKLARLTIRDSEEEKAKEEEENLTRVLDPRFLNTPSVAMEQCKKITCEMGGIAKSAMFTAMELLDKWDDKTAVKVKQLETIADKYEDEIGTYLLRLSSKNLSERDSNTLSMLLHCISDWERISDHAVTLMESARTMYKKKLSFSKKAQAEMEVFLEAVKEIISLSLTALEEESREKAFQIEPLEEVIDDLDKVLKKRHVKRLRKGKCSMDMGFILSDICTNLERVADHCSNIGVSLMQEDEDEVSPHGYLENFRDAENEVFRKKYEAYTIKYKLPEKEKNVEKEEEPVLN